MSAARPLPEFVRVTRGRRVTLVHPDFAPQVAEALLAGEGVRPADLHGRGEMFGVETPYGEVLIRKYLRGGMVARVFRESYLFDNRPLKELQIHQHAWRSGVPTVMPVGVMWQRSGVVYRGAYATLRVAAEDLLAHLGRANDAPAILASCGRAIRAMHQAGIYHADLQVKNILVSGGEALIIDFDGARRGSVTDAAAQRNLARLRRSFLKQSLPLTAYQQIESAYLTN